MSSRIKLVIVISCVVLIICTAAVISTGIIAERIEEKAKQLQTGSVNHETLELFEMQWEKYEKLLSFYTRHSEIENISESVHILDALLAEDKALFRIECNKIITAAQHLKHTEFPYLRNIF